MMYIVHRREAHSSLLCISDAMLYIAFTKYQHQRSRKKHLERLEGEAAAFATGSSTSGGRASSTETSTHTTSLWRSTNKSANGPNGTLD